MEDLGSSNDEFDELLNELNRSLLDPSNQHELARLLSFIERPIMERSNQLSPEQNPVGTGPEDNSNSDDVQFLAMVYRGQEVFTVSDNEEPVQVGGSNFSSNTLVNPPPKNQAPSVATKAPSVAPEAPSVAPEAPSVAPEAPSVAAEAPSVAAKAPSVATKAANEDKDKDNRCVICLDIFTNGTKHHLVTLKCGHLFGDECIKQWLKKEKRCPTCLKPASASDLRKIFTDFVKPLDTKKLDEALKKANLAEKKNKELCAKILALEEERDRFKTQLEVMTKGSKRCNADADGGRRQRSFLISFMRNFPITDPESRCHCYDQITNSLLVTVNKSSTTNSPMFPKYGVRRLKLDNNLMTAKINQLTQTKFMHLKPVKGMTVNQKDGTFLTVSQDKTLKISSWLSNDVLDTVQFDQEPWAIEILPTADQRQDVYCIGFKNGLIELRDLRQLKTPMVTVPPPMEASGQHSTPVISLTNIHYTCDNQKYNALLAVHLDSCWVHRFGDLKNKSFDTHKLSLEGKCLSAHYDPQTGNSLISFRPSQKHHKTTHYVLNFELDRSNDDKLCANVVNILEGGNEQAQMCRSKIFSNPFDNNSAMVCSSNGSVVKIWDYKLAFEHSINTNQVIYDFEYIQPGGAINHPIISCLGAESIMLYRIG